MTHHLKQQAMRANAIIFFKKIGASRHNATKNKIRAHSCGHAQKVTRKLHNPITEHVALANAFSFTIDIWTVIRGKKDLQEEQGSALTEKSRVRLLP